MKEYDIKITETLEKTVTVWAESRLEAEAMVEAAWNKEEYVLGSEDFVGAEFTMQGERPLERETLDVLLVEPGKFPRKFQVGLELEDFQAVVGGDMEVTYEERTNKKLEKQSLLAELADKKEAVKPTIGEKKTSHRDEISL